MRIALVLVVVVALVGCGDLGVEPPVDGGIDAVPADAAPDFFGEACELPNVPEYPGAVSTCHSKRGFCVDLDGDGQGTCRPWCDQLHPWWNAEYVCIGTRQGGIPRWTSDGTTTSKPFVCVCEPPQ